MQPQPPQSGSDGDVGARVARSALVLLAGAVPRAELKRLRRRVEEAREGGYPWEEVTAALVDTPVDEERLVRDGLRAQRDWVVRGGRETPGPRLKSRAKGFLARMLARGLFFLVLLATAVLVLLVAKHQWPHIDVYWLLEQAYEVLPGLRRGP